jgi:hypothetical protein
MATVTVQRIDAVQADIAAAINQTSERSTLSKREQSRLLAQSCAEACDLLADWLDSPWWDRLRPSRGSPIGEFVPNHEHFEAFLGPMLRDALTQAGRCGVTVPVSSVDEARSAVEATACRHPRMTRQELFRVANARVTALKNDVCELATRLRGRVRTARRRQKARTALMKVAGLLTALVLAMAGVSPSDASRHLSEWGEEAIKVIMVHHIAERAQPDRPVGPLRERRQLP